MPEPRTATKESCGCEVVLAQERGCPWQSWAVERKPNPFGVQAVLSTRVPDAEHKASGFSVFPTDFYSCFVLIIPRYGPVLAFCYGNVCSVPFSVGNM